MPVAQAIGPTADRHAGMTLRAVGADSMESLMACWTSVYEKRFPGASVQFAAGLSADGAQAILDGAADISPYAREFFPAETQDFRRILSARPALIAVGGGSFANRGKTHAIAIYVNASNPIESLTWSQLYRVFAGDTALTWGDLGLRGAWQSAPVNVYGMLNLRDTGNPPGIVNYLRRMLNAGAPLADSIHQFAGDGDKHALQQIVDATAKDKHGIGYSGFGFSTAGTRSVPLVTDGSAVAGSPGSVRAFDYLLTRKIYIAVAPLLDSKRKSMVVDFLRLVLEPAGQACIENDAAGFVPLPDDFLARQQSRLEFLATSDGTIGSHVDHSYLSDDGSVRIVGYNDMVDMLEALNRHFQQNHPDIEFDLQLKGTRTAPPGLANGSSAFAPMGAEFSDAALSEFRARVGRDPIPVRVAHASLSPNALSGPLAFFVNSSNPLQRISLEQAKRIFTQSVEKSRIEYWGQLGLDGEWADRKIVPCGLAPHTALATYLKRHGLGHLEFIPGMTGFGQSADAVDYAAQDRDALCFAAYIRRTPAVRSLSVSRRDEEPAHAVTAKNIVEGQYPLDRFLYIYLREPLNEDRDPLLYDYMQLVLSPAGQAIIAEGERGYLPLSAADLKTERVKIFGSLSPGM